MFATAKMFAERMEEFEKMSPADKHKAMEMAARNMAEEERRMAMGIPLEQDFDLESMGLQDL